MRHDCGDPVGSIDFNCRQGCLVHGWGNCSDAGLLDFDRKLAWIGLLKLLQLLKPSLGFLGLLGTTLGAAELNQFHWLDQSGARRLAHGYWDVDAGVLCTSRGLGGELGGERDPTRGGTWHIIRSRDAARCARLKRTGDAEVLARIEIHVA